MAPMTAIWSSHFNLSGQERLARCCCWAASPRTSRPIRCPSLIIICASVRQRPRPLRGPHPSGHPTPLGRRRASPQGRCQLWRGSNHFLLLLNQCADDPATEEKKFGGRAECFIQASPPEPPALPPISPLRSADDRTPPFCHRQGSPPPLDR